MSIATQTRELLLALAQEIIDTDSRDGLMKRDNLRALYHSVENAARSILVAQNELSLITKPPPETLVTISELVAEPRTRESIFRVVTLTHVCQYWRSALVSCPRLWSTIFVKNDHRDFVAACLERSRELSLTVHLYLRYGDYDRYPDCTCIRSRSFGMQVNKRNPCRYHTTIDPLVEADHTRRIRKLDVHLTMLDDLMVMSPEDYFEDVLGEFKFFALPLPILERLNFCTHHILGIDDSTYMEFPGNLFRWKFSPPTKLRHLVLHGCYGGPIQAICNLTSFELSRDPNAFDLIELNQRTFLPFISNSPSLVSLRLSYCSFPDRALLSRVTPVKLPELKSLRLKHIRGLSGFSGLIEVPAFKTLSSLRISDPKLELDTSFCDVGRVPVRAESDDGFELLYDSSSDREAASDWLDVTHNADPSLAFVRFEGGFNPRDDRMEAPPLPLFVNAKILEIGASFASPWYRDFWKDLATVGRQLTTLRLEVTEGMNSEVAKSVESFVKARFEKGMPLSKLERMRFEGMSEEDEEKAKEPWEEFRVGLDIDQYLVAR